MRLHFQEAIAIAAVLGVEIADLDPSNGLLLKSATQLTLDDFMESLSGPGDLQ